MLRIKKKKYSEDKNELLVICLSVLVPEWCNRYTFSCSSTKYNSISWTLYIKQMKEDSERWRKKADWLGNLEPKKQDTDETPGFVLFHFVSDIPD